MDRDRHGSSTDLRYSSQFAALLRYVCEGLRFHSRCGVRRLYAGVLRHSGFSQHNDRSVRHRLVLPSVHQSHSLVRLALYVRRGSGLHLQRGYRMEPRIRLRLLWLLSLVLPVVGAMGILRMLLVPLLRMGGGGAVVANVYGVWGNTAYSRTGAAWANPYTGNYGAATRGAYYNTQTGRTTVAGRGYNTNIYTGNTAGYRGGATYNPNTGIVAGGGAGYAGNIYTGQGTAGPGGFAHK